MKGYLLLEADGEEVACKCEMNCCKFDTWFLLDECRKALNISADEFTMIAAILASAKRRSAQEENE